MLVAVDHRGPADVHVWPRAALAAWRVGKGLRWGRRVEEAAAPGVAPDVVGRDDAGGLEAECGLALGDGVGYHELVASAYPYLAELGMVYGVGYRPVYLAADVGVREEGGVLGDCAEGGRLGLPVEGPVSRAGVGCAEAVEEGREYLAGADRAYPRECRGDELGEVGVGEVECLYVLVVGEREEGVGLAVVAGDAPVDLAALHVAEVLLPARVVLIGLELRLGEEDVHLVYGIGGPPPVGYGGYAVLVGIGPEVEGREVALDEAGAGDEGAGDEPEVHVGRPELCEGGVYEPLAVGAVEVYVHGAPLEGRLAVGSLRDEVDALGGDRAVEVADYADAGGAYPEDRGEGKREVGAVLGEDKLAGLLVEAAVYDLPEVWLEGGVDEGGRVAADLPGTAAEVGIVGAVEIEPGYPEFVEVGFLPVDDDVHDVADEEDVGDPPVEDLCLLVHPLPPVVVHCVAEALDVGEELPVVAPVAVHVPYLLEDDVVPYGDYVPLLEPLGDRVAADVAVAGHYPRGGYLEYLV